MLNEIKNKNNSRLWGGRKMDISVSLLVLGTVHLPKGYLTMVLLFEIC